MAQFFDSFNKNGINAIYEKAEVNFYFRSQHNFKVIVYGFN